MKKMKIITSIMLIITILGTTITASAKTYIPPFDVQAGAVYMVHVDTNKPLIAINEDVKLPPASLVKIMTAILTIENVDDLDKETVKLKLYLNEMLLGKGASLSGYWPNDVSTVRDALYGLMLNSGADAALMLADYVGDSVTHFVEMMNERAQELGCTNTHFANPHGLPDENNYTTAKDMAIIARHAMTLPVFAEIVNTPTHTIKLLNNPTSHSSELLQRNTNQMIQSGTNYYYEPVVGIKTGTLKDSGRCLVTQAKKGGDTYLLVQLSVPTHTSDGKETSPKFLTMSQAKDIYKWAFNNFAIKPITTVGEEIEEVKVKYSMEGDFVRLATATKETALLHSDIDVKDLEFVTNIPEIIEAPITEGQVIGKADIMFAGEKLGEVNLIATDSLERSKLLADIGWFMNEMHTFRMKFVICLIGFSVLAIILLIIRNKNIKNKKYYGFDN